jgi:helicase SWR1
MDRQCEDRAHRIGQIRDVHIYRFVSKHTVEEALLRKANQKRSLDDLVIQRGEFDWRTLFRDQDTAALNEALGAVEDSEDTDAARAAAREAVEVEGADNADFNERELGSIVPIGFETPSQVALVDDEEHTTVFDNTEEDEEGGTIAEYMLRFILRDDEKIFDDWSV